MAIPELRLRKDKNSQVTYGLDFPPPLLTTIAAGLNPATEETFVVPENVTDALFEYAVGTNNFVTLGNTPITIPTLGFSFYIGELNPTIRKVTPGETLRVISDTTSFVVVRFFTVPGDRN